MIQYYFRRSSCSVDAGAGKVLFQIGDSRTMETISADIASWTLVVIKQNDSIPEVIKSDPTCIDAYMNIGICYDNLEDYSSAIEFFDMALELYPLYPKAWLNKAIKYPHKGDIKEALICFDKAIELNKNFKGVFRLFLPKIMIIRQSLLSLKYKKIDSYIC